MNEVEFLNYIIAELEKIGLSWQYEQEIFEFLLPTFEWNRHKKSWYHWRKSKTFTLRKSKNIKKAIAKRLFFDYTIWNSHSLKQKEALKEGLETLLKNKDKPFIDLSPLMPKESPMSDTQKELLDKLITLPPNKIDSFLSNYPQFFKKKLENQRFLLNLVELLYNKGCYDVLDKLVFPALYAYNRTQKKIKIIEAHSVGSLKNPRYEEAILLLESVKTTNDEQLIDIKTATVSNIRRNMLNSKNITKESLEKILAMSIKLYLQIYNNKPHYYPAINLLYLIKLYTLIFNKPPVKEEIIKQIPKNIKTSIYNDKKKIDIATQYYAKVTNLEIKMLLSKTSTQEFELLLEELNPSIDLMQRTLRQIEFFINTVNNFAPKEVQSEIKHIADIAQVFRDKIGSK